MLERWTRREVVAGVIYVVRHDFDVGLAAGREGTWLVAGAA
nr:hypothetical protein [Kibdelosporangium sp. MJ126-NF4]